MQRISLLAFIALSLATTIGCGDLPSDPVERCELFLEATCEKSQECNPEIPADELFLCRDNDQCPNLNEEERRVFSDTEGFSACYDAIAGAACQDGLAVKPAACEEWGI